MKIAVLVKQVPDTESRITLKNDLSGIEDSQLKWIINPYDEIAVEEAIRLKEKTGGEVYVVTLGPARSADAMKQAFAIGADRGVRIEPDLSLDLYLSSLAISKVLLKEGFDIIFAGKQSVDDDCMVTVQYVGEFLKIPSCLPIETFQLSDDKKSVVVQKPVLGGTKEILKVSLPAILGCEKGLNTPRYASLPGIIKAKTKEIKVINASELVSSDSKRIKTVGWALPDERKRGRLFEGSAADAAEALINFLKDEAKLI